MSNVKTLGRALRRFQTKVASLRQLNIARAYKLDSQDVKRGEPGRFRKHHALACSTPRCNCCGSRNAPYVSGTGRLTMQERRHQFVMTAGLAELGPSAA